MVVVIAEEHAAGIILVDMQKHTSAFLSADMLKAGHVDLRNVVIFHPTDALIRSVPRPREISDMGVSVKMNFYVLRQWHNVFV